MNTPPLYTVHLEFRRGWRPFLRAFGHYVRFTGHIPNWPIRFLVWAFCRVRLERA